MSLICVSCTQQVNPTDRRVLREVIGWDRPRASGGQNHLRWRRETGRLLCPDCATVWTYAGRTAEQMSLLEEGSP